MILILALLCLAALGPVGIFLFSQYVVFGGKL